MTRKTKRLAFISWLVDLPYRTRNHLNFVKLEVTERRKEFQYLILGLVLIYMGIEWTITYLPALDIKGVGAGVVFNIIGLYLLDTSVYLDQKRK